MSRALLHVLLSSSVLFPVAPQAEAGQPGADAGVSDLDARADLWRAEHGDAWRAVPSALTGYAEMLHGGRVDGPFAPSTDAEWFELARHFLVESEELTGVEVGTLADDRVVFLPLGRVGSSDKWSGRFRQEVGGIPVEGGFVNVLIDRTGALLSVQTTAALGVAGIPTIPTVDAVSAATAAELAAVERGTEGARIAPPELVLTRLPSGEVVAPVLAWRVDVRGSGPGVPPPAWRAWIDARGGGLLAIESLIRHLDVTGTITTLATPGVAPDTASNPETQQVMPYARVTSSAGTVTTAVEDDPYVDLNEADEIRQRWEDLKACVERFVISCEKGHYHLKKKDPQKKER